MKSDAKGRGAELRQPAAGATPGCSEARGVAREHSWRERDAPGPGGPCAAVCFAWRTRRVDWSQVTLLA